MKNFLDYQKEIANLQYTINLLTWELKITSPTNSKKDLINLISYHEKRLFDLKTSDIYGKLLENAINSEEFKVLSKEEKIYINNLLENYKREKNIPESFYEEYLKTKKISNVIWREAKEKNNYEMFKPYLSKIIDMTKQYYKYLNPSSKNLYDDMLNEYEKGISSKVIDKLFKELKEGIIDLIPKSTNNIKKEKYELTEQQLKDCANYLLNYIGFDLNRGTIGIYPHGFTNKMNYNDIRIAFDHTNDPINFVSIIIHEGGHGIFEQNILPNLSKFENNTIEHLYALHESQSRFFENMLGRNKNFWIPIYSDIKKILNLNYSLDEFVALLNTPKCSALRVEADELTYCMHIILRYEIERDLFDGKINIDDLPKIWNKKTQDYLNVTVNNDSEGLMQDVHWSEGDFGYFPSYLLGSIYDGIIYETIINKLGDIDELLRNGEIKKITKYLIDNIYIYGGAYSSLEILNKMCNKELDSKPLIKYLNKKYGK